MGLGARSRRSVIDNARSNLLAALGDFELQASAFHKRKVIHDPIWGTCVYEPWEVSILEFTVFQRLRGLRQTGFASLTYPTAEHSRFQHTLGVVEAASRIFDSVVVQAAQGGLSPRGEDSEAKPAVLSGSDSAYWRRIVRLAALVHDLGHSVFSHTSERIYGLIPPFGPLLTELTQRGKRPGAAEAVVYLLVTSPEWQSAVRRVWDMSKGVAAPSKNDWERIGRWVMGQEAESDLKFLCDIISGPIDADKLDYVSRDGYTAGIPVGYDLPRLTSTICADPQRDKETTREWWRLTLPVRGINALEQLVMGRLVLNSYLYHHQKCRAAESAFERALAREYIESKTVLGRKHVWDLFALQDADVYEFAKGDSEGASEIRALLQRRLRVRVVEFRQRDLLNRSSEAASFAFDHLLDLGKPRDWDDYRDLITLEDEIAERADLPRGSVVVDIPKHPDYADLENLLLPGRTPTQQESPAKVLNYRDWISAYRVHRAWVRIFGPRGRQEETRLWGSAKRVLKERGLALPATARIHH